MAGNPTELKKRPYLMRVRGGEYLYYRRDGERRPLPGPEGSLAFNEAYERIHAEFESSGDLTHSVARAITEYKASADYLQLKASSQRSYGLYLGEVFDRIGKLAIMDITDEFVDSLRNKLANDVNRWNRTRDLMRTITKRYMRLHRDSGLTYNVWEDARPLKTVDSDQNRRWPTDVLSAVLRESTEEFRALVVTLLLTGQRISDVVRFRKAQFDRDTRTLGYADGYAQVKTGAQLVLHVPDELAATFEAMSGRGTDRLITTPRGVAWTTGNAQETLAGLRSRLQLGRYTLHGLRATGPTAMLEGGASLQTIMAVTGHQTEAQVRKYLRGFDKRSATKQGQEMIAQAFDQVIMKSKAGANSKKFSGLTGRAAANAGVKGQSSRPKPPENVTEK